jgi:hypothetical protein
MQARLPKSRSRHYSYNESVFLKTGEVVSKLNYQMRPTFCEGVFLELPPSKIPGREK